MSIAFSGTGSRSAGIVSAVVKELSRFSLLPCEKVTVQFNPFHEKAKEIRHFLHYISSRKYTSTNPACSLKAKVVSDSSEPNVTFNFPSGKYMVIKTTNLTTLDILKLYNNHVASELAKKIQLAQTDAAAEEPPKKSKRRRVRIQPGSKRRGVVF